MDVRRFLWTVALADLAAALPLRRILASLTFAAVAFSFYLYGHMLAGVVLVGMLARFVIRRRRCAE